MARRSAGARAIHASRHLLRLMARPARSVIQERGVVLQAYRGYGTQEEVFLIGRVFRQPTWLSGSSRRGGRAWGDVGRLLFRRGLADASVRASFAGSEVVAVTDRDGYFRVHLRPGFPPDRRVWHRMALRLEHPLVIEVLGELFIPPDGARQLVISDIDDTVLKTGVTNKLVMLWRLFMHGVASRTPFPGVTDLLAALYRGAGGAEHNPLLYVSRSPWTLYEVLDAFFQVRRVPGGPLLFLREWGLRLWRPFPRRGRDHKLVLIRHMIALYRDLPVILIGDSGQDDPEVYRQVAHEHPGRVRAIYIRDVSRGEPARARAIAALAAEAAAVGSRLLLAPDSLAVAEDAAALGLMAPEAVNDIAREHGPFPKQRLPLVDPAASKGSSQPNDAAPGLLVEPEDRRA